MLFSRDFYERYTTYYLVLVRKYDDRVELKSCEKAGVWKLRLLFLRRLHLIVAALVVLSLYDFVKDLFSNRL